MTLLSSQFRKFIAALTAVSLVFFGLAHTAGAKPTNPELAAFLQAGGSLADICIGSGEDSPGYSAECPDCSRVPFNALLASMLNGVSEPVPVRVTRLATDQQPRGTRLARGPPARGPPDHLV